MGAIALDPENYGLLKDIIDETYTDRIDAIDGAWVFPDGSIQAFATDEGRQLSVDVGEDISIFLTGEDARFVASFAAAKKRNCVKGIACGGTCIAKSKTCSKKSSAGQKKKAKALVEGTKGKSDSVGGSGVGDKIDSLGSFETAVMDAFKGLDKDKKFDGLVPIHKLRSALGDRVGRKDFDDYLLKMQENDVFQLQGGSLPSGDAKELADSVQTELSGLRTYASLLEGGKLTGEGPKSKPKPKSKSESKPADGKKIDSPKAFEPAIMDAYDRLNRDFKMDDLVPIHRLRSELGDRVKREDFDNWMRKMNEDDKFDFGKGNGSKQEDADSISGDFGTKFYATKLKR